MEPNANTNGQPVSPPPPAAPATGTPSGSTGQSSGVSPGSSSGAGSSGATPAPGAVQSAAPSLGTPPAQQQPGQVPGTTPAQTPTPPADWQQRLAQFDQMQQQLEQYRRFEHLIPLGYRAYQQAGQTQQTPPAGAAQPQKNLFGLEPFDWNLLQFVAKDPQSGQLVPMPGAPPDAVLRVQQFQAAQAEAQKKFWSSPEEFLTPFIEKIAQKIADDRFNQQYGSIQQQQAAQSILHQNREWLYEKDAQGNPVTHFDPASGQHRPKLSQWGQFYARAVAQAQANGVTDPRAQNDFAMALVENAAYRARAQQAAAPAQQQQQQQQFLQQQQTPLSATIPTPSNTIPPPPAEMTLAQRLRQELEKAGINDSILQQQLANPAGRAA